MNTQRYRFLTIAAVAAIGIAHHAAAAETIRFPDGKATFDARCAVCHQAGGKGQDGLAPPLTTWPGRYAASAQGRSQLPDTVVHGMYGEIHIADKTYNFKMPSFLSMSDDDLAQVLNYIVFDLNKAHGKAQPYTSAEIKTARDKPLDGSAVHAQRAVVARELGLQ